MPPLSPDDYQALKVDIRQHGVLVEIIKDEFGTTIDGSHREQIVAELRAEGHRVADPQVRVLHSLDDATKRSIARAVNIARRHLTATQRRELVEQQLLETPAVSDRSVAKQLGVDNKTVAAARERMEQRGELAPQARTVGADGKSRPAKVERARVMPRTDQPEAVDALKIGYCDVCGCDMLASDQHVTIDGVLAHAGCHRRLVELDEEEVDGTHESPKPPAPTKPLEIIRVDTPRQAEKLRDLAEAGRLGEVMAKGINAAHKQLREQRRHEEISEHAAASAVDGEQLRVECMDALEFLRSLETGSVDMIWTDPPYYIASRGGGTKVGDSYATFDAGGDGWDDAQWADEGEFLDWLGRVVVECNRVLRPTGNLVMCMDRFLISHLVDLCRVYEEYPHGMRPRNLLAWHKTNAAPNARGNFDSALELAVWAVAGPQATFRRPATGQCSPVWSGPFVSGPTRERWPHPTAKPVEWIQSHLEVLSTPGQLVVDPFGGSGATVEAALRLGRRVIANDRAEKHANMCRARGAAVLEELDGGRGWEEAVPCAGCQQPTNGDETEETGEGRMHAYPCASTWRERDAAKAECDLCGRQHTANEGGITSYGSCCTGCAITAHRAGMKPTRAMSVDCPTCGAAPHKRCKAADDSHDARFEAAKQRQRADFSNVVMEVTA